MKSGTWWVTLAVVAAFTCLPGDARSQHSPPGFPHRDVPLQTGADGRTQSDVFQLATDEGSSRVRLYVRDRNVSTVRGPYDRVCVESVENRAVPRLTLSLVGAPPDAAGLRSGDGRPAIAQCILVQTAAAYRVWWDGPPATAGSSPAWTRPPVFETLEPMANQEDVALERNLNRVIASLPLDGVCVAVTVLRAPFSAASGTIGSPLWARGLASVSMIVNTSPWMSRDDPYQRAREIVGDRGWYQPRPVPFSFDDGETGAFVHPVQTAFAPFDDIQNIVNNHRLDPRLDQYTQYHGAGCYGDPIRYRVRGIDETQVYGFMHVVMVAPLWIEYSESSGSVRRFWEAKNNEYMLHEMVHVHDHLEALNQVVFQTKGNVDHMQQLMAANAYPPQAFRYGLPIDRSLSGDLASFFGQKGESVQRAVTMSVNDFHRALERRDGPGGQVVVMTTDLQPAGPAYIGEETELRRALEDFRRWYNGG